jgi:exosome complex RNA-binding protein Csl4
MAFTHYVRAAILSVACLFLAACGGGGERPIVANNLVVALDEDTTTTWQITASDPNGHVLAYRIGAPPAHGTLSVNATTGQLTYAPAPDYFGADTATVLVTSGKKSATATVNITVNNVPDAPRITVITDQQNNAYALETTVPLEVVDVDGDSVTVSAVAGDASVATITVTTDSKSLLVTPLQRGSTTITVSASDGTLNASRSFDFSVGDVTKASVVAKSGTEAALVAADSTSAPSTKVVALTNTSDRAVSFTLNYNGHEAFTSIDQIARYVRGMPENISGEPFERKLWRFVRDNTYHDVPINAQQWWHDFWPTLNSLGFGFCSHVSAVFVEIARAAGYEARIWGLYGHVVPEILVGGRWEMFDPDLGVYYYTRDGQVAGVLDLEADTGLITSPANPLWRSSNNFVYSHVIADIYDATTDNNHIADSVFLAKSPAGTSRITLPASARLLLPGHWTGAPTGYDGAVPSTIRAYRQAAIEIKPGWTGDVDLPWVLWDVQGAGAVIAGSTQFTADSDELRTRLQAPGTAITSLAVRDNPAGLRLVFMINATWFDMLDTNSVRITGQDVWAVGVGTTDVPSGVDAGSFPDELRRPDPDLH